MTVYPAIDIMDGRCVRLKQGDFNEKTVYHENPVEVAKAFASDGAEFLHLIDLDGARRGGGQSAEHVNALIKSIVRATGLKIQVGGGLRNLKAVADKVESGAFRVILGTSAVLNPEFVKEAVSVYRDKIAVAIDAKNNKVAFDGWEEVSTVSALKLAFDMRELGVKTIIYTDVLKDGMLSGPNISAASELIEKTKINVIVAGGVSTAEAITRLRDAGAAGVIVGKALYTKDLTLKEALAAAKTEENSTYGEGLK